MLGLAQAALGEAHRAGRYAIVTGGRAWKPMLERIAASFGWQDRLDNITVIEQSGGDLARIPRARSGCSPQPAAKRRPQA